MGKPKLAGIALAVLAATTQAEQADRNYYEVIQGDTAAIPAAEFERLEADAYAGFDTATVYPPLINAFAKTTERIWSVIYGEIVAHLTDDDAQQAATGALVFRMYDEAIDVQSAEKMNVSLTREWALKADAPVLPFEFEFEASLIIGLVAAGIANNNADLARSFEPLTIGFLAETRERQVANWRERKLTETELVRWQERIIQAGHFDAYNYWLFQAARPVEYEEWLQSNRAQYDAWMLWRAANPMRLHVPDFQRLLLSAQDPELELLRAGRALLDRNNPLEAVRKSFDKVIQSFEARHSDGKEIFYCARSLEESLIYLAMAAEAGESASVLAPTWSEAYYLKAYALLELGRLGEAREALERAIALSPNNSMYMAEMAYTYQIEKNWSEAIDRYEAAEEAAETFSPPDVKAAELSRAMRGQGFALIELGQLDEAEAIYRKAMKADPEDRASANEIQYIEQMRAKQR